MRENQPGWPRYGALLALIFAANSVTVDLADPFPESLNLRLPQSLFFYCAIAVVAEAVFHLVPAAVILSFSKRLAAAIRAAARTEPVFQIALGWSGALHWSDILVGLNIFAISLTQILPFRR